MKQLIHSFYGLPLTTRLIQCTLFDRDNGVATKGCIVECCPGETPCVYSKSFKFGITEGALNTKALLVITSDSLYNPPKGCGMNIQQLLYNNTQSEREVLFDKLFIPALQALKDCSHFSKCRGEEKLLSIGVGIPDGKTLTRALKYHTNIVNETATNAPLEGFRAKFCYGEEMGAYEVKLPWYKCKKLGWIVGNQVDITRDPSLACGNSTQRYTITGFVNGNYARVGPDPWSTLQGGDFDGDDGAINATTVRILPDKVYDNTPVASLSSKVDTPVMGVQLDHERFEQALRVLSSNIGSWDVRARHYIEIATNRQLTEGMREFLLLSSVGVQREVDIMKHLVREVPLILPFLIPEGTEFASDYIRERTITDEYGESIPQPINWEADVVRDSLYAKLALAAVEALEYPKLVPLKKCMVSKLPFPSIPKDHIKGLSIKAREFNDKFAWLSNTNGGTTPQASNQEFQSLATTVRNFSDKLKLEVDVDHYTAFWYMMSKYNWNIICKVLTSKELALIYHGSWQPYSVQKVPQEESYS
jgi:hypothetical protein